MKHPSIPEEDKARVEILESLEVLYTPAEERFDRITELARKIFGTPIALISLVSEEVQWFKSNRGMNLDQTARDISFSAHAILSNSTMVVTDTHKHADFADNPLVTGEPHIRFYAGQPLNIDGGNIGTLCVIDTEPRDFSPTECDTLVSLGKWVENELKLQSLRTAREALEAQVDEERRASLVDPLTAVWNRRGLQQMLSIEINRSQRKSTPVTIMLIDLDEFKLINDSFGHPTGDIALKECAQMLIASVRPQDVICRYGGDEFMVLLGDCPAETARVIADRILDRFKSRTITLGPEVQFKLGLSIGAATAALVDEAVFEKLVGFADKAVYEAKAEGRGCARFYSMTNQD